MLIGSSALTFIYLQAGEIPPGSDITNINWLPLDDTDVGLTMVGGKMMGKFCIPKGNPGHM